MSPLIPRLRPVGGAGAAPTRRCPSCGHLLLATQPRCPECGFVPAPSGPVSRPKIPQLYTRGPAVVKPIAFRFASSCAVALLGPALALVQAALPFIGVGSPPGLDRALAALAAPLPVSVLLTLPYGRGSLGGPESPIPIAWPTLAGQSLHAISALLSVSWWIVAMLLWIQWTHPVGFALLVAALLGASLSTYLHLSWLAALGEAVADEGPRRLYCWCVGVGILVSILSVIVALAQDSWQPFFLGLVVAFLAALAAQVAGPWLLARDMFLTLLGAYEEVGREERRARRAAEHEPRLPH